MRIKVYISIILSFLGSLMILTQCKKEPNLLTDFNIIRDTSFTIPPIDTSMRLDSIFVLNTSMQNAKEFQQNNTSAERSEDVDLTNLELSLQNPDSGYFGFLDSVEVYIDAEELDKELIGYRRNIPKDSSSELILRTSPINLAPYFQLPDYQIRFSMHSDSSNKASFPVSVLIRYKVTAKMKE